MRLSAVIVCTMLSKIVCQTDVTNAQRTAVNGALLSSRYRVLLIVDKGIQTPYSEVTEFIQFVQVLQFANVDSRQNTQSNLTLLINVLKGICRQSDLLTQVRHIHLVLEGRV